MEKEPIVLILMGSDTDLPEMEKAAKVLDDMEVPYEMDISSAHRTPGETAEYAETARNNGFEAIIAGAGMAAHLAGVIAAHTTLPVIGVPLSQKSATHALNGIDALYATVQMPPGIPVATVGIDSGKNAAYLACSILSIKHVELAYKLAKHREEMADNVRKKSEKLKEKKEEGK